MKKHSRKLIIGAVGVLIAATAWLWQEYKPGPRYLGDIGETRPVWSKDGKALVYVLAGDSSKIYCYDTASGRTSMCRIPGRCGELIISPDHKEIIDVSRSGSVEAYDLNSGKSRTLFNLKNRTTLYDWLPNNYFVFEEHKAGADSYTWVEPTTYIAHPDGTDRTLIGRDTKVLAVSKDEVIYERAVCTKPELGRDTTLQLYRLDRMSNKRTLLYQKQISPYTPVSLIHASNKLIIYRVLLDNFSEVVESVDLRSQETRRISNFPMPDSNINISVSPNLRYYHLTKAKGLHGPVRLYIAPMPILEYSKPML